MQREVAATICNLSLSPEHKVEIAQWCPRATDLAWSVTRHRGSTSGLWCVANLAENVDTHKCIADVHGGRFLIGLMKHSNTDIHREASRAIANLLTSFGHHQEIIEDGLPGLIALGVSTDIECQYNAALAFRKLSPNMKSHRGIIYQGGLKTLFFLIQVKDVAIRRQAATALRDLSANPHTSSNLQRKVGCAP